MRLGMDAVSEIGRALYDTTLDDLPDIRFAAATCETAGVGAGLVVQPARGRLAILGRFAAGKHRAVIVFSVTRCDYVGTGTARQPAAS